MNDERQTWFWWLSLACAVLGVVSVFSYGLGYAAAKSEYTSKACEAKGGELLKDGRCVRVAEVKL